MKLVRTTLKSICRPQGMRLNLLLSGMLFSSALMAQSPPPPPANAGGAPPPAAGKGGGKQLPPGERKHTLSFEDELVEGANAKPELFYLFQKKNFNYKRLIKLRENFIPEMRKTSEEVQRGRSPN